MRRGALLLVAVLAGALVPVAAPALNACAAEGPRAALVVDTGSDVHRYCVALPDDSVSGIDLIVLANEQYGLTYRFGYGGNAVCMLADVGTTGDDCWAEYPDFWGYWRGTSDGGWTWSSSGAHATTVTDGDVEGWAWGPGDGPSSHPSPPSIGFGDVCPVESSGEDGGGRSDPDPGRHPKPQPPEAGAGPPPPPTNVAGETTSRESGRGDDRLGAREKKEKREPDRHRDGKGRWQGGRGRLVATTQNGLEERETDPHEPAAQPLSTRANPGIPAGALLSLGLVGAFGVGGVVINRRRRAA